MLVSQLVNCRTTNSSSRISSMGLCALHTGSYSLHAHVLCWTGRVCVPALCSNITPSHFWMFWQAEESNTAHHTRQHHSHKTTGKTANMCPPWSCISIKHSPAEPPGRTLIGKTSPRQGPPDPKLKPPLPPLLLPLSIRPYCGRSAASNSSKLLLEFGSNDSVMLRATRPPGSCSAAAATLAGCCSGSCRQQECEHQTPAAAWHSVAQSQAQLYVAWMPAACSRHVKRIAAAVHRLHGTNFAYKV
jgi:hypothetical protein